MDSEEPEAEVIDLAAIRRERRWDADPGAAAREELRDVAASMAVVKDGMATLLARSAPEISPKVERQISHSPPVASPPAQQSDRGWDTGRTMLVVLGTVLVGGGLAYGIYQIVAERREEERRRDERLAFARSSELEAFCRGLMQGIGTTARWGMPMVQYTPSTPVLAESPQWSAPAPRSSTDMVARGEIASLRERLDSLAKRKPKRQVTKVIQTTAVPSRADVREAVVTEMRSYPYLYQGPQGPRGPEGQHGRDGLHGRDGRRGPKGDRGRAGRDANVRLVTPKATKPKPRKRDDLDKIGW